MFSKRYFRKHIQRKTEEDQYPDLPYRSVEKDYDNIKNVNSEICKKCGGECCKRSGCAFSPDDFKEISFEALKKEIEKGYISISYYDGAWNKYDHKGAYILRVRNKRMPIVDVGYFVKTGCILLTENGCKLKYSKRPTEGRLLIPLVSTLENGEIVKRKCNSSYSISESCYEWMPHQKLLNELIKEFENKNIPCSL